MTEVRACLAPLYVDLQLDDESFLAAEWCIVAACFGLADFRPQVEQALAVQPGGVFALYSTRAFDHDIEREAADGSRHLMDRMGWVPFKGTAVDALSTWHAFRADRPTGPPTGGGNRNAYRNVGRNDPCPCGSGKKYKKCCGAA